MGGGYYNFNTRSLRSINKGYESKSKEEIFTQRTLSKLMNPHGVLLRESRDSEEHPCSQAIILALDITGSMLTIPHYLVKDGFVSIMSKIMNRGVKDPQVLFMGIGDHEAKDVSPFQVAQFESSDELLDKWLTEIHLEGGGGGNDGESYLIPWYFAGTRTSIDCFEKRKQKGILITIGDEPTLNSVSAFHLNRILSGQHNDVTTTEALEKAKELYIVKHLHLREGSNGLNQSVIDGWRKLLGQDLIIVNRKEDISNVIADIIIENSPKDLYISSVVHNNNIVSPSIDDKPLDIEPEILL